MATPNTDRFGLLRKLLKAIGLKDQAVDEIVDRIVELLSGGSEEVATTEIYPYYLRDDFLTAAEHSFYLVLKQAVEDWTVVCPKVSLSDIFYAKSSDHGEYRTYTNKIDRKHIDFLLCEPGTMRPMAGLELDDKSHERDDRQARDDFVKRVFDAAGLPLVRVRVRRQYRVNELRAELRSRLGRSEVASEEPMAQGKAAIEEIPSCPSCGSPMALRTAKRGVNAGQQFWGCTDYPRCRQIVTYEG
ncbi:MAG: DUF2726 domain-containing protein [Chloroflexi bacterium]|nr:DUF2726 domain-containing protein [Chloroflexota bacterium]